MEDVWKPKSGDPVHNDASYLLNKLLIRNYLSKGTEEKKFDKSIVPKLEEEIEAVDYDWTRTKQILRTNVLEYETKSKYVKTHFVKGRNDRRFDNRNNNYDRSGSRSRSFHKSNRSFQRDGSQGRSWNKSEYQIRTSTPARRE